ncbi:hypothetical protein N9153_02475 [Planctomicrobium sp.]|jgi:hypothetical protein|nr:hypothetical protein [Planctomicrobium sp.]MDB4439770.1 hypothetical protein [Planctomicrobium sp.]
MNILRKSFITLAVVVCAALLMTSTSNKAVSADEELNIKQIMKQAFKGDLVRKVGTDKATAEEKQQLLEMSKVMAGMKPPQGSSESWSEKTNALIAAVEASIQGKPEASTLLKKTTNCAACHKVHKPK